MMAIAGHRMPDPELRTVEAWSMVCTAAGTVNVGIELGATAALTAGDELGTAVAGAVETGSTEVAGGTVGAGVTAVVATGGGATTGAVAGVGLGGGTAAGEGTGVGVGAGGGVGVGLGDGGEVVPICAIAVRLSAANGAGSRPYPAGSEPCPSPTAKPMSAFTASACPVSNASVTLVWTTA
jgi:hypothetical protein